MKTIPEVKSEIAAIEKECDEIKDWPEVKAMTDSDKQWTKIEKEKDKRQYYYKNIAKGEDKLLNEARKQLSNINYILL